MRSNVQPAVKTAKTFWTITLPLPVAMIHKQKTRCVPARVRSKDSGSAKLLVHVSDSQEERDCEERKWMHLRHMIANDLLERGVSSMTLFEFQKLSLGSDQVPNQSRADPCKGLAEKRLCVKACRRSERGKASSQMQPLLTREKDFFREIDFCGGHQPQRSADSFQANSLCRTCKYLIDILPKESAGKI